MLLKSLEEAPSKRELTRHAFVDGTIGRREWDDIRSSVPTGFHLIRLYMLIFPSLSACKSSSVNLT